MIIFIREPLPLKGFSELQIVHSSNWKYVKSAKIMLSPSKTRFKSLKDHLMCTLVVKKGQGLREMRTRKGRVHENPDILRKIDKADLENKKLTFRRKSSFKD